MKASDIDSIVSGLAPVLADFIKSEVARQAEPVESRLSDFTSASETQALAAAVEALSGEFARILAERSAATAEEISGLRQRLAELSEANPLDAISPRLDALEAREQFTATDARAMLDEAVSALPVPQDGTSVTLDDVRPLIEEAVKAIPAPKDGKDGTSVTVAEVLPALTEQVAAHLASLPVPQDGKSVSVAEVVDALSGPLEALHARWALDFERRAADTLQRACERIPKPADGKDGMGFDHIEHVHDGERRGCWRLVRGEEVKEFPYRHEAVIDRGVFKEGSAYERGDGVTFGGQFWIAQKDAPEGKPGLSDDFRLAVRKGRDSK